MKLKLSRMLAILMLVIPGFIATYGFIEVKDALFDYFASLGNEDIDSQMQWFKLIFGFICFLVGFAFIGGWIFFRDRKRNYVAPRFKEKRK